MSNACPDCGVFQRRIRTPLGGEGWLCLNCPDDPLYDAVGDIREALGIPSRGQPSGEPDTAAFAFGLADALSGEQVTSGRPPRVIAASCIYLGSILADDKYAQSEITDAADLSPSVIRKHYRELYEASGYKAHFGAIDQGSRDDTHDAIDLEGWRAYLDDHHAPTTAKTDTSNVRRFAVWYDGEGDPTAEDVEGWLEHLADEGFAPPTIETRFDAMEHYFEWAGLGELDINADRYIAQAWQQRV